MMHRLAVFGHPVVHSKSPLIHQAFARQAGLMINYEKIEAPLDGFVAHAREFIAQGGVGFNITVPFKGAAFEMADELTSAASQAEAVNTIKVLEGGALLGANTDGPGLVLDLRQNLGWSLRSKRILVLGAGGAVQGVLMNLLAAQPTAVHLWNRTSQTAKTLAEKFEGPLTAVTTEALESGYDLVINGTSAGLSARVPDIPSRVIGPQSCCYDMVYGTTETSFVQWCLQFEPQATSDGLGMLVEQAALAFELWFDRQVDTLPVRKLLRPTPPSQRA
jgi:shikimate dehydrogenase